jgi:DNA-binding protein Fis
MTEKFREILMFFCEDEKSTKTAEYTGVNRNTINVKYP